MAIEAVLASMEGHPPIPLTSIDERMLKWKPQAMRHVVSVNSFERSASGLALGRYVLAPGTGVSKLNRNAMICYNDGLTIPADVVGLDESLGLVLLDPGKSIKREDEILFRRVAVWEDELFTVVSQFGEPWSIATLRVTRVYTLKRKKSAFEGPRSKKGLTGGCVFDSQGSIVGVCAGHDYNCTQMNILPFNTVHTFIDAVLPGIFRWYS